MKSAVNASKKDLAETIKHMVLLTSISVLIVASISFLTMEWYAARQGLRSAKGS